jgi:hypothetical protein
MDNDSKAIFLIYFVVTLCLAVIGFTVTVILDWFSWRFLDVIAVTYTKYATLFLFAINIIMGLTVAKQLLDD